MRYHFLDAGSGDARCCPTFQTGDLAKGSATSDPDGYPLYYAGSRDNLFRVIAMDRADAHRALVGRRARHVASRNRCGTTTGTARRS